MAKNAVYDYSTTAASNTDIDALDATGATGLVKSGDNYTRSLMSHLKAKANDDGAVNTVGGTADAITVTLASNPTALVDGMRFSINAPGTNTGAVTIAVRNSAGTLLGTPKVRKWSGGAETALSAGDITSGHIVNLVYDSARDTAAGAFMIDGGASVAAATTSAAGIVELATLAEVLSPPVGSSLVPRIPDLYFPTGHISPSLTIAKNGSDASNDIDVSAFTARDSTDSYNIICAARTKQIDASWAVGTNQGGLDTGTVSNTTYYIWGIRRSDTGVCDVLFSLSSTSPTMPTNYDAKALIGKFTRVGGVNQAPRTYATETTGWVTYTPTFTGFGTATGIEFRSRRVADTLEVNGKFTSGTATASEARITLGFNGVDGGLTIDSTKVPAIQFVGTGVFGIASAAMGSVLAEAGAAYLTFGVQTGSTAGMTKATGSGFTGSSTQFAFAATVPIAGW